MSTSTPITPADDFDPAEYATWAKDRDVFGWSAADDRRDEMARDYLD